LNQLGDALLDGVVFANSLHFVAEAESVLTTAVSRVQVGGRVVFVEYDRRGASRWVPHPIPPDRLRQLLQAAGLSTPTITATQPSQYSGTLYVATAVRTAEASTEG